MIAGLVFAFLSIGWLLIPSLIESPVAKRTTGIVCEVLKKSGYRVDSSIYEAELRELSLREACRKQGVSPFTTPVSRNSTIT